ncbi:MAG: hypothetical protein HY812_07470 [Planctomycetes bacterium]|nr:hypothetical protein [Planctomycetota bacterium]
MFFARPPFLEGVGRILDPGGSFEEYSRCGSPEQADRIALALDWHAVGQDLWRAIELAGFEEEPAGE